VWAPVIRIRNQTTSPFTAESLMVNRRSENAFRIHALEARRPAGPGREAASGATPASRLRNSGCAMRPASSASPVSRTVTMRHRGIASRTYDSPRRSTAAADAGGDPGRGTAALREERLRGDRHERGRHRGRDLPQHDPRERRQEAAAAARAVPRRLRGRRHRGDARDDRRGRIAVGADQRARRRYPRGLRALRLGLGALYDNASASDEISEALDATEARYRDRVGGHAAS